MQHPPKKPLSEIRVLLVQARDTLTMEQQEQLCFVERCRIPLDQFVPANLTHTAISLDMLDEVDAMMIGGSGEYSAYKEYPWMQDLLDLCRAAYKRNLPIFGSCWGHQVLARAFGGTVIYDSERAEFGCGDIELTDAGRDDLLLCDYPRHFKANLGHRDRVAVLPPGAVELAFNASQRNQAFRIGESIYGTQFHSELDANRERERLDAYREYYRKELGSDEAYQRVIESLAHTTDADHLLYDFLVKLVTQSDGTPA